MKIIKNQTLYVCSYCGKRLLSRKGCMLHESGYCSSLDSPHKKSIRDRQKSCQHENVEEVWSYIPGEAVMQPDHNVCEDCGLQL